jgi:hypothetical protein
MLLKDWIKEWLEVYKKPYLKPNSFESLMYSCKYINDNLGYKELNDIKGIHLQRFLNSLKDIPNRQQKVHAYLNECLEYAYRNR